MAGLDLRFDAPRRIPDAIRVADRRPAEFHDDQGHSILR